MSSTGVSRGCVAGDAWISTPELVLLKNAPLGARCASCGVENRQRCTPKVFDRGAHALGGTERLVYERSGENAITREQGFSELAEDIGDGPHHPDRFWHGLTRFMNGLVQVQAGPTQLGVLDRLRRAERDRAVEDVAVHDC